MSDGRTHHAGCWRGHLDCAVARVEALEATHPIENGWPSGISDGIVSCCSDCGDRPWLAFRVTDEFWCRWVPRGDSAHTGVLCLPCLDRRCAGVGLDGALLELQWTGTGHTVAFKPALRHRYNDFRAVDDSPDA